MTNYTKGARFERKIAERIRLMGGIAVRSAGSHGPVDVIGLFPRQIVLIQAKTKPLLRKDEKEEIEKMYLKFNESKFPISFNLAYNDRGEIKETVLWSVNG